MVFPFAGRVRRRGGGDGVKGVSARNQLRGRVALVKTGAVNVEVELLLDGGDRLTAIVTEASRQRLELAPGREVVALIKAPWVILMAGRHEQASSARNQLVGKVASLRAGAVNTEVGLRLPGGASIYAVITNQSLRELGLKEGSEATALIKASTIILGVFG